MGIFIFIKRFLSSNNSDRRGIVGMLQAPEQGDRLPPESAYCPPAPRPQARPLKTLALIRTLKRNPLECWATQHFEQPIVAGGLPLGHALLVHEPGAIRHVLLENAANYRKDRLQRQVLSAGLSDGLLSAEGEQWRLQRQVIARRKVRQDRLRFGVGQHTGMTRLAHVRSVWLCDRRNGR